MADAFTSTSLTDLVKAAYNRALFRALRANAVFDQFATVKPSPGTLPGSSVTFTFMNDLAIAVTPLTETSDPDAVAPTTTPVTVTLAEYGNVVISTRKLRNTTFAIGFDGEVAEKVSWNAVDSVDRLARTPLDASANTTFGGSASTATTEAQVIATDFLNAARIKGQHAALAGANVAPWDMSGNYYAGIIHPDVAYQVKVETGDGAWVSPKQYVEPQGIYVNEIGAFGGFRWVETSRVDVENGGGSGNVDTYTTYFLGRECLAKAEAVPVSIEIGTVADKLNRFYPVGWYTLAGWGLFRTAAVRINYSASSLGTNV